MKTESTSNPQPRELIQAGYRYALSLTHHHYDAEDLVQQAWMKCYYRYGKIKNRALLYTTIRNLFFDQCRRGKIISFEPIDEDPDAVGPAPEKAAVGISMDLDLLLAHLRLEEREALYLNAVEGHSAQEISRITGKPRNSILSLIHRARQKLIRLASGNAEQASKENNPK
ncbi:MAG: RNA polymerase sigma factor [Verrucomicrobiota bacterium]